MSPHVSGTLRPLTRVIYWGLFGHFQWRHQVTKRRFNLITGEKLGRTHSSNFVAILVTTSGTVQCYVWYMLGICTRPAVGSLNASQHSEVFFTGARGRVLMDQKLPQEGGDWGWYCDKWSVEKYISPTEMIHCYIAIIRTVLYRRIVFAWVMIKLINRVWSCNAIILTDVPLETY